jgi:hypothetical protein
VPYYTYIYLLAWCTCHGLLFLKMLILSLTILISIYWLGVLASCHGLLLLKMLILCLTILISTYWLGVLAIGFYFLKYLSYALLYLYLLTHLVYLL